MKILITGAAGFVGKNLTAALENIRDGKDRTHPELSVEKLWLYDVDSDPSLLKEACCEADFVFHLAGVNRPNNPADFMKGNFGFSSTLLEALKACGNTCPVMLSSSIQASLIGRYAEGEYGKSKKAGEDIFFSYAKETGARVLVYRFPNLFGKFCRPHYNSAVATFCNDIARDLPIRVDNPDTELELLYIDDLIDEMLLALAGKPHRARYDELTPIADAEGAYCYAPVTHHVTLGRIVDLLHTFREQEHTLMIPDVASDPFAKKLYATYSSYLPPERTAFALPMKCDARGSFTELFRTAGCGQFSVNISKPGITKGQHWHNTKWEFFIVVAGCGRIEERKIGSDEVLRFDVSGEKIEAVRMLPGYIHNIINLSDTEDLVTVMWANECFNPDKPDTYSMEV